MIVKELAPTTDNLINTLKNDSCGRNKELFAFIRILNNTEGNSSIALNGLWGSGKTFFVKQAKLLLENLNNYITDSKSKELENIIKQINLNEESEYTPLLPVYFDCWEHDNDEDPIITLLYEINKQIASSYNFYKSDYGDIFFDIVNIFTNKNGKELYHDLTDKNIFKKQEEEYDLKLMVNKYFETIIQEKANKLIIFIDELDRCKPTFAIKFLERIKHYFSNDNIVFVFSINKIELEHTINNFYGAQFNSTRYLDRFFNFIFEIPEPNLFNFYQTIGYNVFGNSKTIIEEKVIKYFNITLREIPKFLKYNNDIFNSGRIKQTGIVAPNNFTSNFITLFIVPYMLGLKISSTNNYTNFLGGNNCEEFIDFFLSDKELELQLTQFLNLQSDNNSNEIHQILNISYDALFVKKLNYNDSIKIKKLEFDSSIQNNLMKTMNLLF